MSDKNVMVVEDNEKNRKLMRVVLKAKGYNIIEAATGEEALNLLKNQKTGYYPYGHPASGHRRTYPDKANQGKRNY